MTPNRERPSPWGGQNMVGKLQTVLVRRPDAAFAAADPARWHYGGRPQLAAAQQEHDDFTRSLHEAGAEVIYHDIALPEHADAIFVHDPLFICDAGAIILKMGKRLRQGEEEAVAQLMVRLGVPIHYRLHGEARAEGGDLLWLDGRTLVVGQGFRTNGAGLGQLRQALAGQGVQLVGVDLPYYQGPAACLHLMSLISMVDHDLAVVYRPLLPVALWQLLQQRRIDVVDVADEEFESMATNVLALGPRHCLMLAGNPLTQQRLEAAGCRVGTYQGREISLKAEGGPTCLTRPILRA